VADFRLLQVRSIKLNAHNGNLVVIDPMQEYWLQESMAQANTAGDKAVANGSG
jgi:hypothetical protein